MDFGSGVLVAKTPVDLGLSLISLQFQRMDLAAERFLIGDALPQTATGEDAELDLRHIQLTAVLGTPKEFDVHFGNFAYTEQVLPPDQGLPSEILGWSRTSRTKT